MAQKPVGPSFLTATLLAIPVGLICGALLGLLAAFAYVRFLVGPTDGSEALLYIFMPVWSGVFSAITCPLGVFLGGQIGKRFGQPSAGMIAAGVLAIVGTVLAVLPF